MYMFMCLCVGMYTWVPVKAGGVGSPGAGVAEGWELPKMGAGNLIHILWKNSMCL